MALTLVLVVMSDATKQSGATSKAMMLKLGCRSCAPSTSSHSSHDEIPYDSHNGSTGSGSPAATLMTVLLVLYIPRGAKKCKLNLIAVYHTRSDQIRAEQLTVHKLKRGPAAVLERDGPTARQGVLVDIDTRVVIHACSNRSWRSGDVSYRPRN